MDGCGEWTAMTEDRRKRALRAPVFVGEGLMGLCGNDGALDRCTGHERIGAGSDGCDGCDGFSILCVIRARTRVASNLEWGSQASQASRGRGALRAHLVAVEGLKPLWDKWRWIAA